MTEVELVGLESLAGEWELEASRLDQLAGAELPIMTRIAALRRCARELRYQIEGKRASPPPAP